LALIIGLAAGAAAFAVMLGGRGPEPAGEIDAASRARLEQVLEQADRQAGR
jgi:hypothetical protein